MKKHIRIIAVAAVAAAFIAPCRAQTLNVSSANHAALPLFSTAPGFSISGLAVDSIGDIYYLQNDGVGAVTTQLFKRTAASNYAAPAAPIFDLGITAFGSFVKTGSAGLFLGTTTFSPGMDQIFAVNFDGTGGDVLGAVTGNYDAVVTATGLLISHNPGPGGANVVSAYSFLPDGGGGQMLSAEDIIVTAGDDFSGPVALDSAGSLFYGGSGFNVPDIYRFSASEVAGAFGPSTLTLDAAHRVIANGGNGYLASASVTELWQTNFGALNLIDPGAATSTQIATSSESITFLDAATDGTLIANVTDFTDFSNPRSTVFAIVPEPATAALLGAGLLAISRRRTIRGSLRHP